MQTKFYSDFNHVTIERLNFLGDVVDKKVNIYMVFVTLNTFSSVGLY